MYLSLSRQQKAQILPRVLLVSLLTPVFITVSITVPWENGITFHFQLKGWYRGMPVFKGMLCVFGHLESNSQMGLL